MIRLRAGLPGEGMSSYDDCIAAGDFACEMSKQAFDRGDFDGSDFCGFAGRLQDNGE